MNKRFMFLSALLLTGFVAFASDGNGEGVTAAAAAAATVNGGVQNPAPVADAKTSFLKTLSARVKSAGAQVYAKGAETFAKYPKTGRAAVVVGIFVAGVATGYAVKSYVAASNADNAEDADLV